MIQPVPRILKNARAQTAPRAILAALGLAAVVMFAVGSCDTVEVSDGSAILTTEFLNTSEVRLIIGRAVKRAEALGQQVTIAIADRDGNVLGVFSMTGTTGVIGTSVTKARTAAFLSSNQHAFTTLTACFITRNHFPPGVQNTPAGPLFGVGFSSLPGGDIQPNGSALNDTPGGVPIFKNGQLVGGIGVTGGEPGFNPDLCTGSTANEAIALSAVEGRFAAPAAKRGDGVLIDGIRFLFSNAASLPGLDTSNFATLGTFDVLVAASIASRYPFEGEVNLDSAAHDFTIRAGTRLTINEVRRIISQAAQQASRTRAAIRRPIGVPARVFISVVDVDGSVLGIWRTPDATIFSFDVAAQKARTALAFSDPNNVEFGRRIRTILGLPQTAALSMTTRAIGFLAQDFYPPGIDRDSLGNHVEPGPLFEGPNFEYQRRLSTEPGLPAYGNGITIFPGGIALYKGSELVGAIGISGDGVDQDDLICYAGTVGFEPPQLIRCDQFSYRGVRLPYIKTPRKPEL
jgi:uncharacterized protein GlcG (DUF336 family)